MDWPVSSILETPSITISALPSIIWTKVSNGIIFSVKASPLSKETAEMFPVVFLIIVLLTTEFGIYSMISTMMRAFAFSISTIDMVSILAIFLHTSGKNFISGNSKKCLKKLAFHCKGDIPLLKKSYTIHRIIYTIHKSPRDLRLLCLRFLKWEGVRPVIFLNWFER